MHECRLWGLLTNKLKIDCKWNSNCFYSLQTSFAVLQGIAERRMGECKCLSFVGYASSGQQITSSRVPVRQRIPVCWGRNFDQRCRAESSHTNNRRWVLSDYLLYWSAFGVCGRVAGSKTVPGMGTKIRHCRNTSKSKFEGLYSSLQKMMKNMRHRSACK